MRLIGPTLAAFIFSSISSVSSASFGARPPGFPLTIAFEEAWQLPELKGSVNNRPPAGETVDDLNNDLVDIQGKRLQRMDETGIEFMVLSWTAPGAQGFANQTQAEAMATRANDYQFSVIKNNTARFGGFAAVSMHDPAQAAAELRRTVKEYGFLGALINDYQQSGDDGNTLLFYDAPQYDVFWQAVTELDVPVYMHPRPPADAEASLLYAGRPWLIGPAWQFENDLGTHILGLASNGVFDRFPTLKILIGHNGERIPSDFWRIDQHLARQKAVGMPMNSTIINYLMKNIWITTAGEFFNPLLRYHISQLGVDRVMFSIDYPFETIELGQSWFHNFTFVNDEERLKLARGTAIDILKLKLKK